MIDSVSTKNWHVGCVSSASGILLAAMDMSEVVGMVATGPATTNIVFRSGAVVAFPLSVQDAYKAWDEMFSKFKEVKRKAERAFL